MVALIHYRRINRFAACCLHHHLPKYHPRGGKRRCDNDGYRPNTLRIGVRQARLLSGLLGRFVKLEIIFAFLQKRVDQAFLFGNITTADGD